MPQVLENRLTSFIVRLEKIHPQVTPVRKDGPSDTQGDVIVHPSIRINVQT